MLERIEDQRAPHAFGRKTERMQIQQEVDPYSPTHIRTNVAFAREEPSEIGKSFLAGNLVGAKFVDWFLEGKNGDALTNKLFDNITHVASARLILPPPT